MANVCLEKRVLLICSEQLRFKAAASVLPHPDKVDKGGEDAYFIAEDGLALGTFLLCPFVQRKMLCSRDFLLSIACNE